MPSLYIPFFLALFCFALSPASSRASQSTTDIEAALIIAPNETKSVTINAQDGGQTDIYWQIISGTIGGEDCQNKACIRVHDINFDYTIETFNYQRPLEDDEKEATITLTNLADTPVSVQVQRIVKTCDAQGCSHFTQGPVEEWKVFRIEKFKSVKTAKDGSYSRISGTGINGAFFDAVFIWWKYDAAETMLECAKNIAAWQADPATYPAPYILAGIVLPSTSKQMVILVDHCTPRGDRFNAAPEDDYDYKAP